MLGGDRVALVHKFELMMYMLRLSLYWLIDFTLGRFVWIKKYY